MTESSSSFYKLQNTAFDPGFVLIENRDERNFVKDVTKATKDILSDPNKRDNSFIMSGILGVMAFGMLQMYVSAERNEIRSEIEKNTPITETITSFTELEQLFEERNMFIESQVKEEAKQVDFWGTVAKVGMATNGALVGYGIAGKRYNT